MRVRGQSDEHLRSLLAVQSASQSWEDFRLTCSLLNLDVSTSTISRTHLKRFVESAKVSGENVHSSLSTITSLPANIRDYTVSFDASWTVEVIFEPRICCGNRFRVGKVLNHNLYDSILAQWPNE